MKPRVTADPFHVRSRGAGPCCLYVLPCAYEDILKLGFSKEPLSRMQALHHRYFEFFDLSRSILVETETVRDARDLELLLGRKIKVHQASAPLVVRRQAAGHTEWYRGAYAILTREAIALAENGYTVHVGLDEWTRVRLMGRSEQLYTWAAALLAVTDPESSEAMPQVVRDTLDSYVALDIDVASLLPEEMWRWYARR